MKHRPEQYAFRDRLVSLLSIELIGPVDPDSTETLGEPPLTRYQMGMLYPRSAQTMAEQDTAGADVAEDKGDDEPEDTPVPLANIRFPSSAGITFAVDTTACGHIEIHCIAAVYTKVEGSEAEDRWEREPLNLPVQQVPVSAPEPGRSLPLANGLELYYRVRDAENTGTAAVTVVLLNRRIVRSGMRDGEAFFQVGVSARSADGRAVFVERRQTTEGSGDEDLEAYKLLYRETASFGVGHGCSVAWTPAANQNHRAVEVRTDFAPTWDLLLMDSNSTQWAALEMGMLAAGNRDDVLPALREMCTAYGAWIDSQESRIPNLPEELVGIARDHLGACREALRRMDAGIDLLNGDAQAWTAFQLANQAMLDQRRRTVWLKAGKIGEALTSAKGSWRPFQLAFFLLCLRGLVDPAAENASGEPERELVDLIWFPTGGGKTEAYLGLVAFTIFHRRLRDGVDGEGITVLMRYTLRLLTIQQFERAALLIACCEMLRRARRNLGGEITIGLWVGQGSTPNSRKDAEEALRKLRRNERELHEKNPQQLDSCIWCGMRLTVFQYWIADKHRPRLVISCPNKACDFRDGLPVYLIDEDIYDYKPSMLVATADKFAALPWNDKVSRLFNRGSAQRPPELIIQDELHLISGPLGTLAGLYETAVDELCSYTANDGRIIRPKVVASTATIRRSRSQNQAIFARRSRQFPPPGLNAADSFFAEERSRDQKASRLYVGLLAPAASHSTLMIRVYASLLQALGEAAQNGVSPEVLDPYWTLVGYFNSLRVLGSARMQVQDDVDGYMKVIAQRSGFQQRQTREEIVELTSRIPSSEMKPSLRKMSAGFREKECPDVVIATNMISVGVDVDRLGLMVIMGQPQGTSEYIQASSRVGRQHPGLVITLFNSARTRDRSHYESFPTYHSALYRRVESSSVTPFSARARDRGLHAVLVALLRHTVKSLEANSSAGHLSAHRLEVNRVKQLILDRVQRVHRDEAGPAMEEELAGVQQDLNDIVQRWQSLADEGDLSYCKPKGGHHRYLLEQAGSTDTTDDAEHFITLSSLRDVDSSSDLYLER